MSASFQKPALVPQRMYQLNTSIMDRIWIERLRQKDLFRAGKLTFACDSPVISDHRKMSALTEEVGEVAKECLDAEIGEKKAQARIRLKTELVQVAAVAIAWLESLEQEGK